MKISACMMVKNEEKNLPRVLSSIQNVVDEIIVVDTGSTDSSVIIAELYGAVVYHHPWQKNFSLHRNQSIDYATGDWVLIIDADEEVFVAPGYKKEDFVQWLTDVSSVYGALAVVVHDFQGGECTMSCNSARMFKRDNIRYRHSVHNQPIFEGAAVLNHFFCLHHYGYDLSKEQMRKKFFRTKGLLLKELRDNPDNYDTTFYLCQLYGHHNFLDKSRYWGEKYLESKDRMPPEFFNYTIYYTLARNYQDSGMMEKSIALLQLALKEKPYDPDLASAMCDYGALTKNSYIMAEGARRYIRGYRDYTEDPTKKGGQFYFSMNDDTFTLNVYRLCVATLDEGMRCWQILKPRVVSMNELLRDELKVNLNLVGLPQLVQECEALMKIEDEVLMDIRDVEI